MNNILLFLVFISIFFLLYFISKKFILSGNKESVFVLYFLFCSVLYYLFNTNLVNSSVLDGIAFVKNDKFSDFVQLFYSFTEILGTDSHGSYGKFKNWNTVDNNAYLNPLNNNEKLTLFPVVNAINVMIAHLINITKLTIESFYFIYIFSLLIILIKQMYSISKNVVIAVSSVGLYPLLFAIERGNHFSIIVTLLLGKFFINHILHSKSINVSDLLAIVIAVSIRPNLVFLFLILFLGKTRKESISNLIKTFFIFIAVNLISYIVVLLNYPKYKLSESLQVFFDYSTEVNIISNTLNTSLFRLVVGIFDIENITLSYVENFSYYSLTVFLAISLLATYFAANNEIINTKVKFYLFILLYTTSITVSNPIIMYHFLLFAYFLVAVTTIKNLDNDFIAFCLIIILLPKIYNNPYLPLTSWGLYFNQISFLGISGYTFFYMSKH
jgi:hypothetical protein